MQKPYYSLKLKEILTTENAANATAEQPETAKADTTANSLISQAAAQDSTNNLLADEAAFKKANPLFSVLTPNIDRQSGQIIPTGSLIGYSHVKDTAAVNEILAMPQVKATLPRNCPSAVGNETQWGGYCFTCDQNPRPVTAKLPWMEVLSSMPVRNTNTTVDALWYP